MVIRGYFSQTIEATSHPVSQCQKSHITSIKKKNLEDGKQLSLYFKKFFLFIYLMINTFTGYCTEYSISGNTIQQNIRTECKMFKNNPCPEYYRSIEAYKCEFNFFLYSQTQARILTNTHLHKIIHFSQ